MKKTLSILLLFVSLSALSQGYYGVSDVEFGQNRLQLRKLNWKTINSNNFEFNYYRGGDDLARKAAKIAESEYRKITEVLGYTPFTTMKIFLYNNETQLSQSNIGLTSPILYDGGILNLSRSRIEIPYTGNDSTFHQELVREIAGLFVYDMLYGGSLKEVLQSSLLLTVPDWYIEGISAYIAQEGLTSDQVSEVRAAIARNEGKKISNITGKDAEIIGQSIWHYIAVRYGRDNISNILNLTRIIRTEQSSITSTLGVSFKRFTEEWKAFYKTGGKGTQQMEEEEVEEQTPVVPELDKAPRLTNLRPNEIDTEYYEFEEVNVLKSKEQSTEAEVEHSSTFNRNRLNRSPEELKISSPRAYENLLITQDLKTNFYNDPVRRLGMHNSIAINDLLENHVFEFDLFITPSIQNHDLGASYMNYEKRVDWGFSFKRRSIVLENVNQKQFYLFRPLKILLPDASINRKILLHELQAHLHYPLSNKLRAEFTPSVFFNNDIDHFELSKEALSTTYAGMNASLVYDNTTQVSSMGFLNGTRARLALDGNVSFSDESKNFNRLTFDARHYQPLVKGIQLAGRLTYGKSMGNSPKYTFLGGMENTLNRTIHPTPGQIPGEPGDLRDIVFYNYPGNLRGFDFAKLYGTNYLLTNIELRLALGQYFPQNSLTSSVVRNLQLVLFNDIGTAWNGSKGPWSRQNSLNTQIVGDGNPFYAVVTNFKNPFLIGYGAGIRTTILGFYLKADYGFGLENKEVGPGKFYLSLGHDF
ncbi:hypothetical protein [Jiulongibacter sp. NS-SX5]|uniref:hypothetical protein n=1 Tax=Jiulongibacter sp. NS-SX5 TaxID=3463854 RepID=UPI004058DEFA